MNQLLRRSFLVFALGGMGVGCGANVGNGSESNDEALSSYTFTPNADAEVDEASPNTNYGKTAQLGADLAPVKQSYLRFHVSGVQGTVSSATFRCYNTNPSVNGPAIWTTGNSWSENTLTWNNRPYVGSQLGNLGKVGASAYVSFDVSREVTGNGDYSFVLRADSQDGFACASKEATASERPQLVLTTSGGTTPPTHDAGTPPATDAGTPPPATDGGTPVPGGFGIGTYMGSFSTATFKSTFGVYAAVETIYYQGDKQFEPNVASHEKQIDDGVSPVIDLAYKNGPYTLAQVAAWGSDVQAYFKKWSDGLNTIAAYAKAKNNGTVVYFTFEHEACVKIAGKKYTFSGYNGGQPTVEQSAAAYNKVMAYMMANSPALIRLYWYGSSAAGEDQYAQLITPALVQMATFDPYRWNHNKSTDTAQSLWGSKITTLKNYPFMKNADGSLKPWGLTEWGTDQVFGDANNAAFATATLAYLKAQGAQWAVYFDRIDGDNKFLFTDGSEPQMVSAYKAALTH